jgi:hypothetical protein
LGPIFAGHPAFGSKETHYRPKRINRLANRLLIRDQGVGGSNPLSPTISFLANSVRCTALAAAFFCCLCRSTAMAGGTPFHTLRLSSRASGCLRRVEASAYAKLSCRNETMPPAARNREGSARCQSGIQLSTSSSVAQVRSGQPVDRTVHRPRRNRTSVRDKGGISNRQNDCAGICRA